MRLRPGSVDGSGGTLAAGWLRSDTANRANGATDMGTELGNRFTYDFGSGLRADLGGAVFFTGDFYKSSASAASPDTLYGLFGRIQFSY